MNTNTIFPPIISDIAHAIAKHHGRAYLVGGSVRDELLGIPIKDFDIEVYGLDVETLRKTIKGFGAINEVGESFGVMKIAAGNDHPLIDVSLPRRDSKIAPGHKGFDINVDPQMSLAEGSRRRDFTINAMAKDILTGEIHDFHSGRRDLNDRLLRVVDPGTFRDDPLRVLRGVQFIGRFGLTMDKDTRRLLREMVGLLGELKGERVRVEWEKLFLQSPKPSLALDAALDLGYFDRWIPDIAKLRTLTQDPEHHPEGTVWDHTMLVVDRGKRDLLPHPLSADDALVVLLADFVHDLGKITTTVLDHGRVRSPGHERAGVEPAQRALTVLGFTPGVIDRVLPLVRWHMAPAMFYAAAERGEQPGPGAFRALANRLHPANAELLVHVATADYLGRGPFRQTDGSYAWPDADPSGPWFIEQVHRQRLEQKPDPIIGGHDLMELGWKTGKSFGPVIAAAETAAEHGLDRTAILEIIRQAATPAASVEALTATPSSVVDAASETW